MEKQQQVGPEMIEEVELATGIPAPGEEDRVEGEQSRPIAVPPEGSKADEHKGAAQPVDKLGEESTEGAEAEGDKEPSPMPSPSGSSPVPSPARTGAIDESTMGADDEQDSPASPEKKKTPRKLTKFWW